MAFADFDYTVKFVLTHPTLSIAEISACLAGLTPTQTISVGEKNRVGRIASRSVWNLSLCERVQASSRSIRAHLQETMPYIVKHRNYIAELKEEGTAVLEIHWFSNSLHTVSVFDFGVLGKLAELGIDLSLEFYESSRE